MLSLWSLRVFGVGADSILLFIFQIITLCRNDEARQPLSRKVSIPSSRINPYRMVIMLRLVILCLFLHYRITNPVPNAFGLWLVSVICEIWFAISWILDQFPKWFPVNRETYLDRLSLRYVIFICSEAVTHCHLVYAFLSVCV